MQKLINTFIATLISSFVLMSTVYSNVSCATKEELLKEFQKCVKEKNEEAIMNLFYWQGVKEKQKALALNNPVRELFKVDITGFEFKPLPEGFQSEHVVQGILYRPNLPILGFIEVKYSPQNGLSAISIPYGMKESSFYFVGTIEEKIYEPKVKEISLNVSIMGNIVDSKTDAFEGYYTYSQSNIETKKEFKGNGNQSYVFWGDRIKYCEVRKTSGNSPIGLVINENGKELFKSEMSASYQPIIYKAR